MGSVQAAFDDLRGLDDVELDPRSGTPLAEVTFVVVDLETTGGSAATHAITEVGAVRVRGGEVLGEFQTLVNPGVPIPLFISVLTGLTDSMVAQAPPIDSVLPAFLEFAAGSVLVAHNAGFDVSFLKAAARATGTAWPGFDVIDTVRLARAVVSRDECRNHKLASLAQLFGAETTPDHRALHDARATVDVLHGLIGRLGSLGVETLPDLCGYSARVEPRQRRQRHLADQLPHAPGVYVFRDDQQRPLYVGTSVDIKTRVRQYFTHSEKRSRMAEMVALASSVTPIVCATALEAQVREVRLIAQAKPPYNKRSKNPEKVAWLKLTDERFPRLSVVKQVRDDACHYLGPFRNRAAAEQARAALHDVVPLRQCTDRLGARPRASACLLADLGQCGAPCIGHQSPQEYVEVVAAAANIMSGDCITATDAVPQRLAALSRAERFEEAAEVRDRFFALDAGLRRTHRFAALARTAELVAARPAPNHRWEAVCIRYGRLAGSILTTAGVDPRSQVKAMCAAAESVEPAIVPQAAALPAETDLILAWLDRPGTRLIRVDGCWTSPVRARPWQPSQLVS